MDIPADLPPTHTSGFKAATFSMPISLSVPPANSSIGQTDGGDSSPSVFHITPPQQASFLPAPKSPDSKVATSPISMSLSIPPAHGSKDQIDVEGSSPSVFRITPPEQAPFSIHSNSESEEEGIVEADTPDIFSDVAMQISPSEVKPSNPPTPIRLSFAENPIRCDKIFSNFSERKDFLERLQITYKFPFLQTAAFYINLPAIEFPRESLSKEEMESGQWVFQKMEAIEASLAFSLILTSGNEEQEKGLFIKVKDLLGLLQGFILTPQRFIRIYAAQNEAKQSHINRRESAPFGGGVLQTQPLILLKSLSKITEEVVNYISALLNHLPCASIVKESEFTQIWAKKKVFCCKRSINTVTIFSFKK